MDSITCLVKGKRRKIHLEKQIASNEWNARTYVKGKTVSGRLVQNKVGAKRFLPFGINGHLI